MNTLWLELGTYFLDSLLDHGMIDVVYQNLPFYISENYKGLKFYGVVRVAGWLVGLVTTVSTQY